MTAQTLTTDDLRAKWDEAAQRLVKAEAAPEFPGQDLTLM